MVGSSPRGRGTHTLPSGFWRARPDHPRAGGERVAEAATPGASRQCGSSPRGRGTLLRSDVVRVQHCGSSPRGRGTPGCGPVEACQTDHPRAGGERDQHRPRSPSRTRIIPARAGNATCAGPFSRRSAIGSSPRGRGTRLIATATVNFQGGSSPRGRGTRSREVDRRPVCYVGSSPRGRGTRYESRNADTVPCADHPRAGGERPWPRRRVAARSHVGSSPRGRGTHHRSMT